MIENLRLSFKHLNLVYSQQIFAHKKLFKLHFKSENFYKIYLYQLELPLFHKKSYSELSFLFNSMKSFNFTKCTETKISKKKSKTSQLNPIQLKKNSLNMFTESLNYPEFQLKFKKKNKLA